MSVQLSPMRAPAHLPLSLALLAALAGTGAQAGSTALSQPATERQGKAGGALAVPMAAAARPASSTPSLGEAFGPSTEAQISLAEHLRTRGAIFYGAFWCQHCFRQKVLFGQEAGDRLPYVECAKDEAGARVCEAAGVSAYPTWVMGQERLVGVQTLRELATWSGYSGSMDFGSQSKGR